MHMIRVRVHAHAVTLEIAFSLTFTLAAQFGAVPTKRKDMKILEIDLI